MNTFVYSADSLMREMEDLLRGNRTASSAYNSNFPPSNVFIDKETGEYVLELAVAGYDPKAIEMTITNKDIHISSPTVETREERLRLVKPRGIKASAFEVRYEFPAGRFDIEKANAEFENGILRITLPLAPEHKPRALQLSIK